MVSRDINIPPVDRARWLRARRTLLLLLFPGLAAVLAIGIWSGSSQAQPLDGSAGGNRQRAAPADLSPYLSEIPLKTARSGILPEEAETYYRMIGMIRDMDPSAVTEAARQFLQQRHETSRYRDKPLAEFPVFFDMYQHPEAYQGRPVTMRGHIQRSVSSPAGPNEFGVRQLCEAWLYTEDSQAHPTAVVGTQFPPEFPIGEQTIDHVTVTGYIYRMYTYEARDTGRYAPLLIANRIEWTAPTPDHSWIGLVLGALGLLAVSAMAAQYLNARVRRARPAPGRELPPTIVSLPDERSEVRLPGNGKYPGAGPSRPFDK